jgi:hypothetical protein
MLVAEQTVEIRVLRRQGKTTSMRKRRPPCPTVLLRELGALGDTGGYNILKDHFATLRPLAKPEPSRNRRRSMACAYR